MNVIDSKTKFKVFWVSKSGSTTNKYESTKAKQWFRRKQQEEDDYDTAEEEDEMEMAILQEVLAASGAAGRGGASDGDEGEL